MICARTVAGDHEDTLRALEGAHTLMVITKGGLLDQQSRLARSGIGDYVRYVEIVSSKTPETYAALLGKCGVAPQQFLMDGNSLKSDVFPVLALGGTAVYIPYHITWAHETAGFSSNVSDSGYPNQSGRWHELEHMDQLPQLVEQLQYHPSE